MHFLMRDIQEILFQYDIGSLLIHILFLHYFHLKLDFVWKYYQDFCLDFLIHLKYSLHNPSLSRKKEKENNNVKSNMERGKVRHPNTEKWNERNGKQRFCARIVLWAITYQSPIIWTYYFFISFIYHVSTMNGSYQWLR